MSVRYSAGQVAQLKRKAKELRSSHGFSQTQALDEVARAHGWANWPLLSKNSLPSVRELVSVSCDDYPEGTLGVFLVRLDVEDEEARAFLNRHRMSFRLPQFRGWFFRGAGARQHEFAPYIDLQPQVPHGVFIDSHWRAILSVNGVQDDALQTHTELTLDAVLAALQMSAVSALLPTLTSEAALAGGMVRLFYSAPGSNGIAQMCEHSYATVAEAKAADDLPLGAVKVGIPLGEGRWLSYQQPFGWSDESGV